MRLSAYVAWLVVQEFGTENTVLLFHDTKAEHPDADRFRKQVSEFVGVPITEVSDGGAYWEVIGENGVCQAFISVLYEDFKAGTSRKSITKS